MTELQTEATGETVGEAKWQALRELERLLPGLDKSQVRFQVVSEGERGLLGVGYTPARVIASVAEPATEVAEPAADESELGSFVREMLERIGSELRLSSHVTIVEDDESVLASFSGADLGLLIGRRGATIDAVQYLVNSAVFRKFGEVAKRVAVDAARYRERRQATLETLADQVATRVRNSGEREELEPMSAPERKIVHLRLQDEPGVETESEGEEPHRYVVVLPSRD
ncbi:MAG: protein jag [Actinobacteria bacterium]|nr:protein jag [Actinomycetota bacterium]